MNRAYPPDSRLRELAAERATLGLDEPEATEFDRLLHEAGHAELDLIEELELAAASVHLAYLPPDEGPPAGLNERLRRRAEQVFGPEHETAPHQLAAPTAAPPSARPWGRWLAAAALLAAALSLWLLRATPTPGERMRELVANAADVLRLEWEPGPDALGEDVTGTLVWSPRRQEGYLRLSRLPRNDPRALQYQLWIFDARRADPPVDGGVFDVDADGEVVIPIDAKLEVFEPHLFAITAERPGGVVVSKQERVVALARRG